MMRPYIEFEMINRLLLMKIMYSVAYKLLTLEDFKKIYHIQAFGRGGALSNALPEHVKANPELIKQFEEYMNKDENYPAMMKNMLIAFVHDHPCKQTLAQSVTIPLRAADFMVEHNSHKTWFWVEERVEIESEAHKGTTTFKVAKLMIDYKNNELLVDDGFGWSSYARDTDDHSKKIQQAYESFLAERELLKDDNTQDE